MIVIQVYEEDLAENLSEFISTAIDEDVSIITETSDLERYTEDQVGLIIYLNKYDLAGDTLRNFLDNSKFKNIPVILLVNDTTREDLDNTSFHLLKLPFELEELSDLISTFKTEKVTHQK